MVTVTHLAVCGDSFGAGHGLPASRCFEDNFSGIVAGHYGIPQRVYARSGCCNFTIYLQVRKIIEQMAADPQYRPFVLITTTFHERMIFPVVETHGYQEPNLRDVEYQTYIPYGGNIDGRSKRPIEFDLAAAPRLVTETVSNMDQFMAGNIRPVAGLFRLVTREKFEAIKTYIAELFDTGIKQGYDNALFVTMVYLLNKHNIPHVIMGHYLNDIKDEPTYMQHDWGTWCRSYPDAYGSGHCNEEGNRLVGEAVIKHIQDHGLL